MKKIMKIVLIIFAILVVFLIVMYAYYGGFQKISFRIENQGGETIVYEDVTGDTAKLQKCRTRFIMRC